VQITDLLDMVARLALDVVAMLALVGWLYRRRVAAPEMTMVFAALNIGLFAALTEIGSGHFPTGVGFGLFGLLSLVRLRSTAFTLKDVAYTFIALVLALVNGLPNRDLPSIIALDVVLLLTMWVVDETRSRTPASRVLRLTLDRAVGSLEEATAAVSERLDVEVLAVVIEDVDLVRETTRVAVRHVVPDRARLVPEPVVEPAVDSPADAG
jgi:hypothetical protein